MLCDSLRFKNGANAEVLASSKVVKIMVYVYFFIGFVPLVLSDSDWSEQLTYDSIYNNTKYAQIQHARPQDRTNYTYISINPLNNYYVDNSKHTNSDQIQEVNIKNSDSRNKDRSKNSEKLLVGVSHDPYSFSVPDADYKKGVRSQMMTDSRGKRGVSQLYNMIYCATGCDPIIFKGYGCYCGFMGSGRTTDGIDKCCQMHDRCYENIYCPFYTVYFQPYYWKCYHNEPLCALENHHHHSMINGCAGRLCECDRLLAMCLRRYRCPRRRALCRSSPLRLIQNLLLP